MTRVSASARMLGRIGPAPGQDVTEFALDNGQLNVGVLTYGATVVRVQAPDRDGVRENLVLRLPSLTHYLDPDQRLYLGSTMGRFARIVANGSCLIAGTTHQLALNAGLHHIHGGPQGFDARHWTGSAVGGERSGRIVLTVESPDGDQGYPGNVACTATFELDRNNQLALTFEAETDRPTLLGLSNHIFWNLAGTGSIDSHLLRLRTHQVLESNAEFVPTGRILSTRGSPLDFTSPRQLRDTAVDDFFPLPPTPERAGATWAATLTEPRSGRCLEIATDESGLAVYTGDLLPARRSGICLQPSPWPDAPNRPGFPTSVLLPGDSYVRRTAFHLSHVEVPSYG